MSEVSCKVFEVMLDPLEKKGVDLRSLVAGTGLGIADLRDKRRRLPWKTYVQIMRNIRPHFSDEEYVEVGRGYMRSPGVRFAFLVARLVLSPMDLYRWFNTPREGVGNQMFSCVVPSHRELAPNKIEVDLTLPEGYEVCWDFFVISSGNMQELPCLFGQPRAEVALARLDRGARMTITVSPKAPVLAQLWRWLARPFAGRQAARELKTAHEDLLARYEELEATRSILDNQARRLQIAYTISSVGQSKLDPRHALDSMARAFVDDAGFASAALTYDSLSSSFGEASKGPTLTHTLAPATGAATGSIVVTLHEATREDDARELLEFVAPTAALTLENATYRDSLERQVELRTAELRAARDNLAATVEQLKTAQSVRERFFGNISHEFRTPLSLIMLAVADIEKRAATALDSRARESLSSVGDSARKLLRLVDELLLLAAAQEGELAVKPEPTDLATLCVRLADSWRLAAEASSHAFTARIPSLLVANVDPVAIERVIANLVSNAFKYTPEGGHVELELADTADGIRISVFDSGAGIDEDLAARLFGRFERTAGEGRRKQGTGLGLHLSKQLVEEHGGTIAPHPRPSGGTELRVMLPSSLRLDDAAAPTVKRSVMPVPSYVDDVIPLVSTASRRIECKGVSKGTVLLAEDDLRLAAAIADLLSEEYTVLVAHDGTTALEVARKHKPQLLVTDVEMPGLSGVELAREFRALMNDVFAPTIILSAVMDLRTRVEGLDAGAVDYVTKPFDPLELKARVRSQFRMREISLRLHRAEQQATLGFLTTGLAHELRNPANGIVNAIEPLLMLLPDELKEPDHPVAQLVGAVSECAEQVRFLSRQLLGFRRSDAAIEMDPRPLRDVIDRAVSLSSPAFDRVQMRLQVDSGAVVRCSPPLLTQVFTNLLENAAHAAGPGGWVQIQTHRGDGRVTVEVTDSGPGVPADLRTKVFEPFFTTKPPGVGNGLGLPLSRDIAMRHGGNLEIRSDGGATAFVVELPDVGTSAARANAV